MIHFLQIRFRKDRKKSPSPLICEKVNDHMPSSYARKKLGRVSSLRLPSLRLTLLPCGSVERKDLSHLVSALSEKGIYATIATEQPAPLNATNSRRDTDRKETNWCQGCEKKLQRDLDILHSFKNTEAPSSCWTDEHDANLVWKG